MLIEYVYVVDVSLVGHIAVNKNISKRKVVKHTQKYVTVEAFGDTQKLDADKCFVDFASAQKYAEEESAKLIAKLENMIAKLKKPVEESIKIYGITVKY